MGLQVLCSGLSRALCRTSVLGVGGRIGMWELGFGGPGRLLRGRRRAEGVLGPEPISGVWWRGYQGEGLGGLDSKLSSCKPLLSS